MALFIQHLGAFEARLSPGTRYKARVPKNGVWIQLEANGTELDCDYELSTRADAPESLSIRITPREVPLRSGAPFARRFELQSDDAAFAEAYVDSAAREALLANPVSVRIHEGVVSTRWKNLVPPANLVAWVETWSILARGCERMSTRWLEAAEELGGEVEPGTGPLPDVVLRRSGTDVRIEIARRNDRSCTLLRATCHRDGSQNPESVLDEHVVERAGLGDSAPVVICADADSLTLTLSGVVCDASRLGAALDLLLRLATNPRQHVYR